MKNTLKSSFALFSLLLAAFSLLGSPANAQSNGTPVGSPSYVTRTGFGQAITLNGTSQYVLVPDPGPYDFLAGSSFTIEGDYQTSNTSGVPLITSVHYTSGSGVWIGMIGGKLTASAFGSSATIGAAATSNDGAWHEFALVVVNGTAATLYQDGVSVATGSGTYTPGTVDAAYIGAFGQPTSTGGTPGNFWNGQIDEIRISSTARYTGNFTPGAAPFVSDSSTKSLYHLDGTTADAVVTTQTITADNAAWVVSPYNHNLVGSGSSSVDISVNPGYYRRIYETGATSAAVTFNTATGANNFYAYRWDGGPWVRFAQAASVTLSPPANQTSGVYHLLDLAYAATQITSDRWSNNPPLNAMQFTGLVLSSGASVSQPPVRPKKVIVYVDSIGEGQRDLSATSGTSPNDQDATLSAYFALQDTLNAEVGLIGFSGQGVVYTGNTASENVPALPSSYNLIYAGVTRSFAGANQPDGAIYCEGQNDLGQSTSAWLSGMNSVVAGVGAKHSLIMGDENGYFAAQEQQVTGGTYGLPAVLTFSLDSYDGVHPTAAAHHAKMLPAITSAATALLYPAGTSTVTYLAPTVTASGANRIITFPPDTGATSYLVERSVDGRATYQVIGTLSVSTLTLVNGLVSFTDTTRPALGMVYYHVVTIH